jgi:hypothetical protein
MNSDPPTAYDFLMVKSKSEETQLKAIAQFAARSLPAKKLEELVELANDAVPFLPKFENSEYLRLWATAIWLSDIGTVHDRELRKEYLADIKKTLVDLELDFRVISSLSTRADRAISIVDY